MRNNTFYSVIVAADFVGESNNKVTRRLIECFESKVIFISQIKFALLHFFIRIFLHDCVWRHLGFKLVLLVPY